MGKDCLENRGGEREAEWEGEEGCDVAILTIIHKRN